MFAVHALDGRCGEQPRQLSADDQKRHVAEEGEELPEFRQIRVEVHRAQGLEQPRVVVAEDPTIPFGKAGAGEALEIGPAESGEARGVGGFDSIDGGRPVRGTIRCGRRYRESA